MQIHPLVILSCLCLTLTVRAETDYESFSYQPGLLPGSGDWKGEEKPGCVNVQPGQLKYDGLAQPKPGRILLPPTASKVFDAMLILPNARTSPFFSFLFRVDDTKALAADKLFGIFRMASNGANPSACGIYLKKGESEGEFLVLGSKRANPEKTAIVPAAAKTGVVHLIVGRYNNSKTPHSLDLWLDPATDTFGAEEPPAPSAVIEDGINLSSAVNTIIVGGGVGSPGVLMDEIRVGDTWADVTPNN